MCGRLARAADPAGFLAGRRIRFHPGVNNEQNHSADLSHGLPAIAFGMAVLTADSQSIIEYQTRGLQTQTMIAFVGSVLRLSPDPGHAAPPFM